MLQFGYPMPLAPTAMAFVLLACLGVPASALESAPVTSARLLFKPKSMALRP